MILLIFLLFKSSCANEFVIDNNAKLIQNDCEKLIINDSLFNAIQNSDTTDEGNVFVLKKQYTGEDVVIIDSCLQIPLGRNADFPVSYYLVCDGKIISDSLGNSEVNVILYYSPHERIPSESNAVMEREKYFSNLSPIKISSRNVIKIKLKVYHTNFYKELIF